VGSAAKVEAARASGYAHIIDTSRGDFAEAVRGLAPTGCDVVYDSVGKDTWRGSLKVLKPRGMFVIFGQSSGPITDFKLGHLASGGSLYATRPTLFDYIRSPDELASRARELFARLAAGSIKAHIGLRLPLSQAAEAHRALASRRTVGATVLSVAT
jgi:NADPH2:quinone reductase